MTVARPAAEFIQEVSSVRTRSPIADANFCKVVTVALPYPCGLTKMGTRDWDPVMDKQSDAATLPRVGLISSVDCVSRYRNLRNENITNESSPGDSGSDWHLPKCQCFQPVSFVQDTMDIGQDNQSGAPRPRASSTPFHASQRE